MTNQYTGRTSWTPWVQRFGCVHERMFILVWQSVRQSAGQLVGRAFTKVDLFGWHVYGQWFLLLLRCLRNFRGDGGKGTMGSGAFSDICVSRYYRYPLTLSHRSRTTACHTFRMFKWKNRCLFVCNNWHRYVFEKDSSSTNPHFP